MVPHEDKDLEGVVAHHRRPAHLTVAEGQLPRPVCGYPPPPPVPGDGGEEPVGLPEERQGLLTAFEAPAYSARLRSASMRSPGKTVPRTRVLSSVHPF